jgi:hypothetical protein
MKLQTFHVFIALLVLSWALEFGLGIFIVRWFWGVSWLEPNQISMAEFLATGERDWTAEGVLQILMGLFVGAHGLYALCSLLAPKWERWHLGARKPSQREQDAFDKAFSMLARAADGPPMSRPRVWKVCDGMGLQSRWVGYVLIIDRELLQHRFFPALLAHELGHANAEDRLARRLYAMLPQPPTIFGIIGGFAFAIGHILTYPAWAAYWRERIYSADAFAATLGQGHNLITALEFYQKLDTTTRGGRVLKPVPYVEQRIDRLQRLQP